MTSSNKVPMNWMEGLKMADDVEVVAVLALERILDLVGSEYTGQKLAEARGPIEAQMSDHDDLALCNPERISSEIMSRECKIREAIRLLELHEVDRALAALRS